MPKFFFYIKNNCSFIKTDLLSWPDHTLFTTALSVLPNTHVNPSLILIEKPSDYARLKLAFMIMILAQNSSIPSQSLSSGTSLASTLSTWHIKVQWSSGYDFCLTFVFTEGLQFDPGLNHIFPKIFFIYFDQQPTENIANGFFLSRKGTASWFPIVISCEARKKKGLTGN